MKACCFSWSAVARRLSSLRELGSELSGKNTRAEVITSAERQLNVNLKDLPFTLIYLFDQDGKANLACATANALSLIHI